ncbi:MAG: hypothetical protein IJW05_12410 [Lentisphaeria bacterium]|nr:hypothetical protein [Lentisphaeria bacterium]
MKFELGKNDPKVKKYLNMNKERIPKTMRMFTIEAYRQLTITTPVDTGRARWGWNCSFERPDFSVPMEAPEGQKNYYGLDAGRAEAKFKINALSNDTTLYISNAVPYIVKLNEGWSRQAPARFFELCFESACQKVFRYLAGMK